MRYIKVVTFHTPLQQEVNPSRSPTIEAQMRMSFIFKSVCVCVIARGGRAREVESYKVRDIERAHVFVFVCHKVE